MYQKIRKTKSVQCLAYYLIKVVAGFSVHYQNLAVLCPPPPRTLWSYLNKALYSKVTSVVLAVRVRPCAVRQPLLPRFGMARNVRKGSYRFREKSRQRTTRYHVFGSVGPGCIQSCLPAQKRFLLFKGMRSFKKKENISGNVEECKVYRLIPLTPPSLVVLIPLKVLSSEMDPAAIRLF
jgi:hypothetical protein